MGRVRQCSKAGKDNRKTGILLPYIENKYEYIFELIGETDRWEGKTLEKFSRTTGGNLAQIGYLCTARLTHLKVLT